DGTAAVDPLERDPILERGDERERLERRPRLPPALYREIELRVSVRSVEEVAAADHRHHRAGPRVEGDEGVARVLRVRKDRFRSLLGDPLQTKIDRRVDTEAALEQRIDAIGDRRPEHREPRVL